MEGEGLRGDNEMEWDSDRDGDMVTESKTVWRRKFDRESREEGGGRGNEDQTDGDT